MLIESFMGFSRSAVGNHFERLKMKGFKFKKVVVKLKAWSVSITFKLEFQ